MTDYEKLQNIISEIDLLISKRCDSADTEFTAWHNKAELFVARKFGKDSFEYKKFEQISYYEMDFAAINGFPPSIDKIEVCKKGLLLAKSMLETFLDDILPNAGVSGEMELLQPRINYQRVFIVHGHDGELKQSVARVIEKQGIEAIILTEQANQGKTIIEKFENYSDVGGAVCLFTADDICKNPKDGSEKTRARQNVVFETGYFIGALGRDHIVILADHGVEMPSDLSGFVRTNTANWEVDLLKELKAMGYSISFDKQFG